MKTILLDTDMLTDCDDAAALAMLLNLEKAGECRIAGVCVSSRHPCSAAVVHAILTYYGRPDIPVGAPKNGRGAYRADSCFLEDVSQRFPHALGGNEDAEDAVRVYRRILAEAEDGGVTIATIGYMTNLADLLDSPADDLSPLEGRELVRRKVACWVCMGGNFPVDTARDNVNFTRDMPSAYKALTEWPGIIHFVGREVGHNIFAGEGLRKTPEDNPVRRAYELHRSRFTPDNWNHHTADPSTVLYAVRGCGAWFRLSEPGFIDLKPNGAFTWTFDPAGTQRRLLAECDYAELAVVMEELMCRGPYSENCKNF